MCNIWIFFNSPPKLLDYVLHLKPEASFFKNHNCVPWTHFFSMALNSQAQLHGDLCGFLRKNFDYFFKSYVNFGIAKVSKGTPHELLKSYGRSQMKNPFAAMKVKPLPLSLKCFIFNAISFDHMETSEADSKIVRLRIPKDVRVTFSAL